MSNQCKIFISSAYERDLQSFREDLAAELRNSGHIPLLFEENFGFWGYDTIQKCIDKVKDSDMMVLIISHKSGSFTKEDQNVTATYVEYHTALIENKLIIPFIKNDIAELYRRDIKRIINQEIENFKNQNGFAPDHTFKIMQNVKEYIQEHHAHIMGEFESTDEFVWSFLYDVDQQSAWMYPIEIARSEETTQSIKEYLSEFVKLGVSYIPLREEIIHNTNKARIFSEYVDFTEDTLSAIRGGKVNTNLLLSKITGKFEGGKVYNTDSPYVRIELGSIEDCNGVTLYKNTMDKMICISYGGATTPPKEYKLENTSSFVTETYNQDSEYETLYYEHSKKRIYLTRKIGNYVICTHYKLNGDWTEKKVKAYEKQLFSVILDTKARLYYNFVFNMIGGFDDE